MVHPRFPDGVPDMLIAGDDEETKARVAELIQAFGWRAPRIAEPPAPRRAVSASQAVRELGYGAQGNEVNRSLKSVWFAAPPSMGLTLKISSTVRSVEPWS